jgi:hypothetical protein
MVAVSNLWPSIGENIEIKKVYGSPLKQSYT